jgi:hypothetical protein
MYVKRNVEERSRNHSCRVKVMSAVYPECVCVCVALRIQHAKRMRLIIVYLFCPAVQYFSVLYLILQDFRKNL